MNRTMFIGTDLYYSQEVRLKAIKSKCNEILKIIEKGSAKE